MDYGWTAFNDLPSSYDDSEFIYSAGVGVRAALTKYLQFRCDVAFPLRDTDWAEDESMEFYISVQGQF
jgi:hemolysin activation/secretion protein